VREGGTPYKRFLQIILLIAGFAVASKLWGLQHAIGLFIFLMIHEYGHVAAMKLYGVPVHGIFVLPFIGAVAISKDEPPNLWHRFMIAYMGPVFGAIVTLKALVALFAVGDITFLRKFMILCAAVSIFNLLPLGILDGGRIVMSIAFSMHLVVGYLISIGTVLLCVAAALLMKLWFLWIVAYVAFMEMISNIRKKGLGNRLKVAKRMPVRQILSAIALYIGLILFFIVVLGVVTQPYPGADEAFERGVTYHEDGHYEQAISEYNKAIEINPKLAAPYYNRGIIYDEKGQYDKAISDYSRAVLLEPMYLEAYNSLAWLLATCPNSRYRNGVKAVEHAQKALEIKEDGYIVDTLAAAYAEVGRFEDAIITQKKAIALSKKEGSKRKRIDEYVERLNSYKANKPWREK
jgi:Zn-dependent protease